MDVKSLLAQPFLHIRLWQDDGAYVAQCLDLPGCVSQGDTRDEAMANIHDAISGSLEILREDGDNWKITPPPVEVIERPMSDFVRVPVR